MTTPFRHDDAGTPVARWEAAIDALPRVRPPAPGTPLLVVVAHPDDETLGAGGLIATLAGRGAPVTVVVASDGSGSHPASPTTSPAELARRRSVELHAATDELARGAALTLLELGLPDGRLAEHEDAVTDVVTGLVATLPTRAELPSAWVVTHLARDGHPDHEAVARAVARAVGSRPDVRRWEVPIWALFWGGPELIRPGWFRFPVDHDHHRARTAAGGRYLSQTRPLSPRPGDEAVLTPDFLERFARPVEVLVDPVPRPAGEPGGFDDLYTAGDPWDLAASPYEREKRAAVLAALPATRFRRAFEPGCGPGYLTELLLDRCDEVVAADASPVAVRLARERLGVPVRQLVVPDQWPDGRFDLLVLHEVGYYVRDLDRLLDRLRESRTPETVLVACHWRHPAPDHPWFGDEVHDALRTSPDWSSTARGGTADYALDVLIPARG